MYKKRIRAWGIDKKLKESEVLEILHQKSERDFAGKPSKLFIRGRNVDLERIQRYVEHKRSFRANCENVYERVPFGAVVLRTPSPVALASPPDVRKLEEIMTVLRDYIRACTVGPQSRWVRTPDGYSTRSPAPIDLSASRSCTVGAWDELASLHLSMEHTKSPAEMFQALDSSLNNLKDAMKDELPEFVVMMIYFLRFTWPGHPVLLYMFRKHVGDLSSVLLGPIHPLTLIWKDASNLEDNFDEVVEEILHVLFKELSERLGADDDIVELARRGWRFAPNSLEGMSEVMRQYQTWLAAHADWPSSMLRSFIVQTRLIIANFDEKTSRNQLLEAHATIQSILGNQETSDQPPASAEEATSLANLDGGLSLRLGNTVEAERGFLRAVEIARRHKLPSRNQIIPLKNLEMLYKAKGKHLELAKTRRELQVSESKILQEIGQAQ